MLQVSSLGMRPQFPHGAACTCPQLALPTGLFRFFPMFGQAAQLRNVCDIWAAFEARDASIIVEKYVLRFRARVQVRTLRPRVLLRSHAWFVVGCAFGVAALRLLSFCTVSAALSREPRRLSRAVDGTRFGVYTTHKVVIVLVGCRVHDST
eukprot:4670857-Prymnesium_polylepis.1